MNKLVRTGLFATLLPALAGLAIGCTSQETPSSGEDLSENVGSVAQAAGAATPNTVLILGTTITGGMSSREVFFAQALGYDVEIVTNAQWAAKSTADFATYRAIIMGDTGANTITSFAAAEANKAVWSPAVTGNVIIVGTDPVDHRAQGGDSVTLGSIYYAVAEPGKTGLYACLSSAYEGKPDNTPVSFLSGVTSLTSSDAGCYNNVHKVADHIALDLVTDASLSNWSCSVHSFIDGFAPDFLPLAIAKNVSGSGSLTFPDGTYGIPYIIARGVDLSPINCGNNVVDVGEECDDGNTDNGDGCNAQCHLEELDGDGDGATSTDNCPFVANPDQLDADDDGVGDACDNCPSAANPGQENSDGDAVGNACDNCLHVANPGQQNSDADVFGDACDNCPSAVNASQVDADGDGVGDGCDNCPSAPNPSQTDTDSDGRGDACDNCPAAANVNQTDTDSDGRGDACDNCPSTFNQGQLDADADGAGDACDEKCVTLRRGALGAVEDATISAGTPGAALGADGEIFAGPTSNGQNVALLRFDLGSIPSGAQITSAKLGLMTGACCGAETVKVHRALAGWSEATVTWAGFGGAYDPAPVGEITSCAQPAILDLTPVVTAWHANAATNFGLALAQAPSVSTAFRSSEAPSMNDRPALRVCYLVPDCVMGTGDCDGDSSNGCETVTLASVANCGACGRSCSFAHAEASCVVGTCMMGACAPGYVDCNNNPLDGCEAALDTDPSHCGACGTVCDNPHGTASCAGGACVATCATGYGSCDGDAQNGCEKALNTLADCGGCGQACALANANVTCVTGTCDVVSCKNDYGNCDNNPANGCEAPLNTIQNCGGCGHACSIQNGSATCQAGICKLGTCDPNWGNCDGVPYNGCESNLLTDVSHCNGCATACSNAHGTTSCDNGTCAPVCVGLWASCDNNKVNGCETALNTVSNCGGCGAVCQFANASAVCPTGTCQFSACNTGYGSCDGTTVNGCETPLNTLQNCGACGAPCVTTAHATAMTCASLSCKVASCEVGFADCDAAGPNGCEVDTQSDAQNCGGCGMACANAHGTSTCQAGACVPVCANGYADCDGDPANGCETNTKYTCGTCDASGTSCRDIKSKDATAVTDVYVIDPDGAGPMPRVTTLCEMTADGGGWTAMFAGKNGQPNAFDRFDGAYHTGNFTDATSRLLRYKPAALGAGTELLVSCGAAAVKFPMTATVDDYFSYGRQSSWQSLTGTVVAGTVTNVPNRLWTGSSSDAGFIFMKDTTLAQTFASSHPTSTSYNYCNSVSNTTNSVRVYYREPAAPTCAAGTSDCDNDRTNGCETNVSFTGGACASGGRSCADILAQHPGAPSGVYVVDQDGEGPRRAEAVRCDMTTDGGGWTALFVGKNGMTNAFDRFDTGVYTGAFAQPTGRYLQRKLGLASSAGAELAVECGGAMVKFPLTQQAQDFFAAGKQQSWLTLVPTVIAGTVTNVPNRLWSGNGTDRGFIFTKDNTSTMVFASSYGNSTAYDKCNSVADTSSPVAVYVREPLPAACAAGKADCNRDPSDGCETLVSLSGGACTSLGSSCREILSLHPGTPSGNYLVDIDGAGALPALPVYCDMTSDGGGWTAVYSGKNGSVNVFDRFEPGAYGGLYRAPDSRLLVRKAPWSQVAGAEMAVSCGAAMVKFPVTAAADAFFSRGTQAGWQSIPGGTVLSGTVVNVPNTLWTGSGTTYGFAFAKAQTATQTFGSIYPSTSFDRCNSALDTTSTLRVFFREPSAPACAAGLSSCDGDPTNGCETNDTFTAGACIGEKSCREILRKYPGAPTGTYLIDTDGTGPLQGVRAYCDMTTDGGGYTMYRVDDTTLAADQTAYASLCEAVGMEIIVPRTKAHAQSIYTWNGGQAANLVNVYPKLNASSTLKNWVGVCRGASCPFWISDNQDGTTCNSTEPNGTGNMLYRLYRTGAGCGIEGTWADSANTVSVQDWVICSTNDKAAPAPPPPSGLANCDGNYGNGCETVLATSLTSCGTCGNACSAANGAPVCQGGSCGIGSCNAGFADCDGQYATGCETDILTSLASCGACGQACSGGANGTGVCAAGVCDLVCDAGFASCDGSDATGCETDLSTSLASCGACGQACSAANATPSCVSGICGIDTCDSGFADCDMNDATGCEIDLVHDDLNCGACGLSCVTGIANATGVCQTGTCAYTCNAGFGDCDNDASNGCETAGGCNLQCAAGTTDCDGIAANGCEVDTTTTSNCGGCGVTCAGAANASAICAAGACGLACDSGFANCDGQSANGCETSLSAVSDCGSCGNACGFANAGATCVAGACAMGSCDAGHGDCDGQSANGCEVALTTPADCGACGVACGAGELCIGGACKGPECAMEEQCNGKDDDCDGQIDEGLTTACESACGAGTVQCVGGQWTGCLAPQPAAETCNGLDDDCDGVIDDGLFPACQGGCAVGNGQAPSASIANIPSGMLRATPLDVIGTTSGGDLHSWVLEWARDGSETYHPIATGKQPVNNGVLGTLYPTDIDNGIVKVRLRVKDCDNLIASDVKTLTIEGDNKMDQVATAFSDVVVPLGVGPLAVVRTYDNLRKDVPGDFGPGTSLEIGPQGKVSRNRRIGEGWQMTCPPGGGIFGQASVTELEPHIVDVRVGPTEAYRFQVALKNVDYHSLGVCWGDVEFTQIEGRPAKLTIVGSKTFFWMNDGGHNFYTDIDYGDGLPYDLDVVRLADTTSSTSYRIKRGVGIDQVTDSAGNTVTKTPSAITSSTGASLGVTRNAQGRVTSVTDPAGNAVLYGYDANGMLASVTDRDGGVVHYYYTPDRSLERVVNEVGDTAFRMEWDGQGRLKKVLDGNQKLSTNPLIDRLMNSAEYKRLTGQPIKKAFDPRGKLVKNEVPGAGPVMLEYDLNGLVTKKTDAAGNVTQLGYDAKKNLTSVTNALGQTATFANSYDAAGTRTKVVITDMGGAASTVEMAASDRPTRIARPGGSETLFTYDAKGLMTLKTVKNGLQQSTMGYAHDARGLVTQVTAPGGYAAAAGYDANGRMTSMTVSRTVNGALVQETSTFAYDKSGRRTLTVDPMGGSHLVVYDAAGKLLREQDPFGHGVDREYDTTGNETKRTKDPQPGFPAGATAYAVVSPSRLVTATVGVDGVFTQYEYDGADRMTKVILADGSSRTVAFEPLRGLLAGATDALGNTTSFEYDALSRRTKTIDPLGAATTTGYNAVSKVTSVTDPLGHVTTYEYDAERRLTKTVAPDGAQELTLYDPLGRMTKKVDPMGHATMYEYDAANNLTKTVEPTGSATQFFYDEVKNLIAMTDANGHTRSWTYDAMRRPVSSILPSGATATMEYDLAGRPTKRTTPNGDVVETVFDQWSRATQRKINGSVAEEWAFTKGGRRASMTTADGTTTYAYDSMGQLASVVGPGGQGIEYGYTADGRVAFTTTPAGQVEYAYDAAGRLTSVTDPAGGETTYQYDLAGRLLFAGLPDGTHATYGYDARGRALHVEHETAQNGLIALTDYEMDAAGFRTKITEATPGLAATTTYGYDAGHKLITEATAVLGGPSTTVTYAHDAAGNRTLRDDGVSAVAYAYDADDRMVQEGNRTYGYDPSGNLTSIAAPAGTTELTWDAQNRLAGVVLPDGTTTSYAYDADGMRVARSVDGARTDYLLDSTHPFADVVEERQGGALLASYTYGNGRIARLAAGAASYYHGDAQGTVKAITDASGAVTATFARDAFGVLRSQTGSDASPFGFQGEQEDPETGLYYLRARYYHPGAGRFLSRDDIDVDPSNPATFNPYVFGNGSPATFTDPGGHFSMMEVGATITTIGILATIALPYVKRYVDVPAVEVVLKGEYVGTGYGEDAVMHWAQMANDPNNPAWQQNGAAFLGHLAALWTPDTWMATLNTLFVLGPKGPLFAARDGYKGMADKYGATALHEFEGLSISTYTVPIAAPGLQQAGAIHYTGMVVKDGVTYLVETQGGKGIQILREGEEAFVAMMQRIADGGKLVAESRVTNVKVPNNYNFFTYNCGDFQRAITGGFVNPNLGANWLRNVGWLGPMGGYLGYHYW